MRMPNSRVKWNAMDTTLRPYINITHGSQKVGGVLYAKYLDASTHSA